MVDDEAQEEISAKKSACVFKEEGERSVIESAPENKERARSTAAVGKKSERVEDNKFCSRSSPCSECVCVLEGQSVTLVRVSCHRNKASAPSSTVDCTVWDQRAT